MPRPVLIALMLAAGLTGCADNILKERPVQRAATKAPVAQASLAVSAAQESTVCNAYRRQLVAARTALLTGSGDREALERRELTLEAVIADACE